MMGGAKSTLFIGGMPADVKQLHVAVMQNDWKTVRQLVASGTNVDHPWVNVQLPTIKDGTTPLCEAVSLNHRHIVEELIQASAAVDKPDSLGCTPLHKAAYHGRNKLTKLLIHAGADVHSTDQIFNTPLHVCVENALVHNDAETIRVLIQAGASVNMSNMYGKIPLHYAALRGLEDIIRILLNAQSEIDHLDLRRKTPLHYCIEAVSSTQKKREAFQQRLPAIKVLISFGCDTLNLATWIRKNVILSEDYHMDEDFYSWYSASRPESLKHLCRVSIQRHLHLHSNLSEFFVNKLVLPNIITNYLLRKLLSDV